MAHTDAIVTMREEVLRMGLTLLPPDINDSQYRFTVPAPRAIRYGLGAVKGAGEAALEGIIAERQANGRFKDLFDFCRRIDTKRANKRVLEALIGCGAMDGFGLNRASLMKTLPKAIQYAEATAASADSGQNDLFGLGGGETRAEPPMTADLEVEWSERELLARERDTLGFYLSGHPIDAYRELIDQVCSGRLPDLVRQYAQPQPVDAKGKPIWQPRTKLLFAAWVADLRFFKGGDGKGSASYKVTLDDRATQLSTWIDVDKWSRFAPIVKPDSLIFVIAEIGLSPGREGREPEPRLYAPEFIAHDEILRDYAVRLSLDWRKGASEVMAMRKLLQSQRRNGVPGGTAVEVRYRTAFAACELDFGADWKLRLDDATLLALQQSIGADCVKVAYKRYQPPQPERRFSMAGAGASDE